MGACLPSQRLAIAYDGSARIAIHIGAFRFVCTNLAVGGGGVFAGGFMSIHAGEIPIEKVADQLSAYLQDFDRIVWLYQAWADRKPEAGTLWWIFDHVLQRKPEGLWREIEANDPQTIYEAYNVMTNYATHRMRSYRTAFDLLARINHGFQKSFRPS